MSDKSDGVSFTDSSTAEGNNGAPQFLTREDADSLKAEIMSTIEDTISRKTQSFSDKVSSRLEKDIASKLSSLKNTIDFQRSAGMDISPEVEHTLQQKAIAEAYSRQATLPPAEPTPPPPAPSIPINQYVDETVIELEKVMGIGLTKSDPEAATLDSSSPQKFIASYTRALQAKKARETPPPPSANNVPVMGGAMNPAGLAGQYQAEIAKLRPGDVDALINIKTKYRRQGLRI